jgi:hypothetical protein
MAENDIQITQGTVPSKQDQTSNMSVGTTVSTRQMGVSASSQSQGQSSQFQKPSMPSQLAKSPQKKQISLEDEAMLAQQQAVIAPPDKYSVPTIVKEKFPDLVQLIKETESMNDEERDYWFQILPIMTEEQIRKFRDILLNEKIQLQKLDKEYEQELNRLNEKHMLEWKEFEMREKRKAIKTAELKSQEEERAAEEELLRRLSKP